jgi:hypothetical protein
MGFAESGGCVGGGFGIDASDLYSADAFLGEANLFGGAL